MYDNQSERFSTGDKIEYKGEQYTVERVFPPTRSYGKWSLGVASYRFEIVKE